MTARLSDCVCTASIRAAAVMLFVLTAALSTQVVADDEQTSLHARIDEAIRAGHDGPFAEKANDGEFLRRLYLDLTGSVPDAETARQFLADESPDKRERMIDQLLASPQSARHLATVFDVMLMERRGGNRVSSDQWRDYLRRSFAENRPLNEIAAEILAADGARRGPRAAAKFYLDRDAEVNLLTRDVARLFFGKSLECAQCHDHPLVGTYLQEDFYGLYGFLSRGYLVNDKNLKKDVYAEKAEGEIKYQSVFIPDETYETQPHLPGESPITVPELPEEERYVVKPEDKIAAVPKFSLREQLARLIAGGQSADFCENMANRLWALMMGRGLVEPVGWHHEDNPPSHPELLKTLSDELCSSGFDVRHFLRELALSQTYQRSGQVPEGLAPESIPEDRYAVAVMKPMSPEQLAWSLMQATGVVDLKEVQNDDKLRAEDPRYYDILQADVPRQNLLAELIDQRVAGELKGSVGSFTSLFTGQPGEPDSYQANVQQALFLSNSRQMVGWLNPASVSETSNLSARLAALEDPTALADELYFSVLTRQPNDEERQLVVDVLSQATDENRPQVLRDVAWALLTSTEFRFNH